MAEPDVLPLTENEDAWLEAQTAFENANPNHQRGFSEWRDQVAAAIRVLQRHAQYPVPTGWRLVPLEPDDVMIDAAHDTLRGHDDLGLTGACMAYVKAAPPPPTGFGVPWQETVIDALIVAGIYRAYHDINPRQALKDLIEWECQVALDPRVSERAKQLRDTGEFPGEVTVTTVDGRCVAVTRNDAEGRVLSVLWEEPQA